VRVDPLISFALIYSHTRLAWKAGMKTRALSSYLVILFCASSLFAQSRINEQGIKYPTEEQLAASKRLHDLLQKPDFITLRLTYSDALGRPTDTPQSYKVKDSFAFKLFITQSLSEQIELEVMLDSFYYTRTELFKDGDSVPYSKEAQRHVQAVENVSPGGSAGPLTLPAGRESGALTVRLEDWYEPLGPGHYQLSIRKRFDWTGEWIQSNSLTFEVEARRPAAIPDGLRIEMVPSGLDKNIARRTYQLASDVHVSVVAVNNSEQRIRVEVVDNYYGDRPQLFKDGQLVPYISETARVCRLKEEHASSIGQASNYFLDPNSTNQLGELSLNTWYGALPPGSYRLVNRRRFEIDGPWTADSPELLFEVVR
jgi:hypothetical protein